MGLLASILAQLTSSLLEFIPVQSGWASDAQGFPRATPLGSDCSYARRTPVICFSGHVRSRARKPGHDRVMSTSPERPCSKNKARPSNSSANAQADKGKQLVKVGDDSLAALDHQPLQHRCWMAVVSTLPGGNGQPIIIRPRESSNVLPLWYLVYGSSELLYMLLVWPGCFSSSLVVVCQIVSHFMNTRDLAFFFSLWNYFFFYYAIVIIFFLIIICRCYYLLNAVLLLL